MKVLVTGASGFIGRNLCQHLAERADIEVVSFTSEDAIQALPDRLSGIEFVVHLAGANRPLDLSDFMASNHALTELLCDAVAREASASGRKIPILYSSSIQAELNDSPYAQSKRAAEQALTDASEQHAIPIHIFRLPNVFGKWCRPNYNSVVATFCWNIARGLPIEIRDADAPLTLVYIDDVVERFTQLLDGSPGVVDANGFELIGPQYQTTVGRLAEHIQQFRESRSTLTASHVGTGFLRALNATYLSYLPEEDFAYSLKEYADARGKFVEVLKTPENGQFSYFTAVPGVTRGGHYHHTKAEKFLVLKGRARFRFRHILDGRVREVVTSGEQSQIVEIVPGWAHDITNIGTDELIVMLWANEVFDPQRPDTYSHAT